MHKLDLHVEGVNILFSNQFEISGPPETWIHVFLFFFTLKKKKKTSPSSSVVEDTLFCCEAPEMFCGLTQLPPTRDSPGGE